MSRINLGLAESVAKEALKDKNKAKEKQITSRIIIVCLSVLLAIAIISGTVIAVASIKEQQYALNMQYANLIECLANGELTSENIDSSGNGIAAKIEGDNNTISGGELNGED